MFRVKPGVGYRLKLGLCGILAGGSLLSATAAALTLGGGAELIDLAPRREANAEALSAQDTPNPAGAAAQTRAALAQAPMTASAWARLAYLERASSGALTPAALDQLERSYAVAPFGPDITPWRVRFMFEHWTQLTPPLRAQAAAELRTLARHRDGVARDLVASIDNPSGRLAASLTRRLGQGDRAREVAGVD